MSVLAERVERAVQQALDKLNGDLAQLVDQELDRRLQQLVAERLAATQLDRPRRGTATVTCRTCGEVKPADQFERGRRTCRECRRRQERARAARNATEADSPSLHVQSG